MILNYFKNISIQGVINWVLFAVVVFFIVKDCKREHEDRSKLEEVKSAKTEETKISIAAKEIAKEANQKGDTVVIYKRAEPIIKTLELRVEDKKRVDSLLKVNNIKESKLQSLATLYSEAVATNLKLTKEVSNNKGTVWTYRDKYLVNTIYKKDTSFMSDVWLDVTTNHIDYSRKKNWFFGQDENLTKVFFNSPYLRSTGLDYLEIKQKERPVDLQIKIDGKYMHQQKEMLIGPKIQLRLGRFGINGGYYLNPGGRFGNTVWYGGEYKIY